MRRIRDLLGLSALLLMTLGGCALTENQLRPPKPPEEYNPPPENDSRYSKPIEYPKDTMDNDALLKKSRNKGPQNPVGKGMMGGNSSTPGRVGGY
jgi:hypothetical protein